MSDSRDMFCVPRSTLAVAARLPVAQTADVLAMLAICPQSADLVETNPALGVCVASGFARAEASTGVWPVNWFRQKRRELCRRLGFGGSESSVRLLAKIRPEAADVRRLRRLRETLSNPYIAPLLRHVAVIQAEHLIVASALSYPELVSFRLFTEVVAEGANGGRVNHCALLSDTIWLLDSVQEERRVFRSLRHLLATHHRLAEQTGLSGPHAEDPKKLLFPSPPIPGIEGIEPILSAFELREEARVMEHCVERYLTEILAGRRYVYRMLRPERGTIGLRKRNGDWCVFDYKGRSNHRLGSDAVAAIRLWLYPRRISE